jgi:methionyl-tRNA formyltransferase
VSLRDEKEQAILKELNADLMIVVAYGLILPKAVLQAPHLGCINIHASLLPRWRGAAPIQRAIFAGDEKTGITIMQMDEGLDTGPMLDKVECRIESQDTSESLHDRLALLGAKEIIQVLEKLNSFSPISQDATKATYAQKITKDEAKINWDLSADEISRQVRAFNPWPVAVTSLDDQVIRIWKTEVVTHEKTSAQPGAIMQINSYGAEIATGKGVLRLLKIQLPGGKALPVADVLNAKREILTPGKVLKS